MSVLLIDVGNSRLKWARLDGDVLADWGMQDRPHPSALEAFVEQHLAGSKVPSAVLVASVAKRSFSDALSELVERRWGVAVDFIVPQRRAYGVVNGYADPLQLGADRWVSMVWARHTLGERTACLIDCGTAITLDVLSAAGEHLGGMIAPGLWLMESSLREGTGGVHQAAQRLSEIPVSTGPLAHDTVSAVRAGVRYAAVGMIERAVAEFQHRIDRSFELILTGGDADELQADLGDRYRLEPDLVLKGLAVIAGTRE